MHPVIYASTAHQPTLQSQQQLASNGFYTDTFKLIIGFKTAVIL